MDYPLQDPESIAPYLAVERHALRLPNHTAVTDVSVRWSYWRLHWAVGQVAKLLAERGPVAAGRVGVVKRRTAGFVAAILGCMRAGVPFSVIDAAPDRALRSDIATVLDPAPPEPPGAGQAIDLHAVLADEPGGPQLPLQGGPEQPSHYTDWAAERFHFAGDDRFGVLPGSSGQLMCALSTALSVGATLSISPHVAANDADVLAQWLLDNAVSVAYMGPPLLRAITAQDPVRQLPVLRYAFIDHVGELTCQDVSALRRIASSCRCVSLYRVNGTGQPLAVFAVPDAWAAETAPLRVPLGREVPGVRLDLLNAAGRPTVTGEVGEIFIVGQRTGHLGRRGHDGTLHIAGRIDGSAATPGCYEDPVETVVTLRDLPEVCDAIVTECLDIDGRATLASYVASQDPAVSAAGLRRYLTARLPEYLVPEHLVLLDRIPLTPDGDYDLAALPDPSSDSAPADTYLAPRTPIERQLTAIFEELLDVDHVGVQDTFFDLNGFSLLATQLASRIRDTFKVELSLREVFQSPTVEGLAQLIVLAQAELADAEDIHALLVELE